jgi:glyceraldehyde 3-phosphate dehydrogenase
MKIGINGLGRIGRLTLRAAIERGISVAAINTSSNLEQLAYLLQYDSTHGKANFQIEVGDSCLRIKGEEIAVFSQDIASKKDTLQTPWQQLGIDMVLECSGKFNKKDLATMHLSSNNSRVIVSAPCDDADATIVFGVNEDILKPSDQVISIGSCTTNALAPIVKVLHEAFGIESGYATTIHSYTFDQNLLDNFHHDPRRARCATTSMIPTKSGITKALKLVLPKVGDRISGSAIRVPVPNVSLIDFSFKSASMADVFTVNEVVSRAVDGQMGRVLSVAQDRLVSIDFNHNPYSSIFDPFETQVVGGDFIRVLCWYDNEWAFVNRMLDVGILLNNLAAFE